MRFRKRYGSGIFAFIIAIYYVCLVPSKSYMTCVNSMCEVTSKSIIGKVITKRDFDISPVQYFYIERYKGSRHTFNLYRYYILARTYDNQDFIFFENHSNSSNRAEQTVNTLNKALEDGLVNLRIKY